MADEGVENANNRLNRWFERLVLLLVTVAIGSTQYAQHQADERQKEAQKIQLETQLTLQEMSNALKALEAKYDTRLAAVEKDLIDTKARLAYVESHYLELDMLKRMELFLTTIEPEDANWRIIKALEAEIEMMESKQ